MALGSGVGGEKERDAKGAIAWGGGISVERKRNRKRSMDGQELFWSHEARDRYGPQGVGEEENERDRERERESLIGTSDEDKIISVFNSFSSTHSHVRMSRS